MAAKYFVYEISAIGYLPQQKFQNPKLFWVKARSSEIVLDAIAGTGASFHGEIKVSTGADFCLPKQTTELRNALLLNFELT